MCWKLPAIELMPGDVADFSGALKERYDWIIFTSVNGVRFTRQRLIELDVDVRVLGDAKVAAIGEPTAKAIQQELALKVDLLPKEFVAEALAAELIGNHAVAGKRFLLLRADIARPLLKEQLEKAGATVMDIAIYETKPLAALPAEVERALDADEVHWITFASSSSVKNFFALRGGHGVGRARLVSIGPVTSATLRQAGFVPTLEASTHTIDGIVQSILSQVK